MKNSGSCHFAPVVAYSRINFGLVRFRNGLWSKIRLKRVRYGRKCWLCKKPLYPGNEAYTPLGTEVNWPAGVSRTDRVCTDCFP